MIIRQLTFSNFLIFKGRQTLDLDRGLYVIHGETGFGKTTFLNGISWALLGRFNDRQGARVPDAVLLNQHAKKEQETEVLVEMVVNVDGEESLVRRTYDASTGVAHLYVRKGETTLHQDDAERFLRGVLDREVARFFLFDGEDLRRYEEMLAEGGEPQVREAVEHILGLPALMNAVTDLRAVAQDFRKKATSATRQEGKAEQAVLYSEQTEKGLDAAKEDLAGLEAQHVDQEVRRDQAEEVLGRDKALNQVLIKRDSMRSKVEELEKARDATVDRRQEALKGTWEDVLAGVVAPAQVAIEGDLQAAEHRERDELVIEKLNDSLSTGTCDQCSQPLHGDAADHINKDIEELRSGLPRPSRDLKDLRRIALALMGVKSTGRLNDAVSEDKRLGQLDRDIVEQKQMLSGLTVEAGPGTESAVRKATEQLENALKSLGFIEEKIKDAKEAVATASATLREAQLAVQKLSTSTESATLNARADTAEHLADLYEQAIGIFRDERRDQVGKDASEIFLGLTTSDEATGLRIDKNYGLVTLDSTGTPVPGRSAGQEQIVAFSLIGALNKNATRTAPVVMDTPLGRLDRGHRANVLKYLSDMADQVFLLVHSAEVDDSDLNEIRDQIVAEYEMRKEDEFYTVIERRQIG